MFSKMEHCSKIDNDIKEPLKRRFMDPSKILEELFDKKTLAVLRLFSGNPEKQYYLREVSRAARVPIATVFRIVRRLVALGIIEEIKIKKFKIYQYGKGKEAKFVDQLIEVRRGAVEEFVELCRPIEGIQQVILHGKRLKDKAHLLIIGTQIPTEPLIAAVARIKEDLGFTIVYLMLEPHQYEQMAQMGLYSDDRQVLLRK
jgi:Fe2+ or Zn2+ uptake regulation protein